MKILCPADGVDEVRELAALGAREFYGGFLTREWAARFTLAASANRRSFPEAQVGDEKTLRAMVSAAHGEGAAFALTVNSPFYTREQEGPLRDLIARALDAGVDTLIASDIGLILDVRERWPLLPIQLSTMAEVTNTGAVAFYKKLGIERITLPRHLALGEIETLVEGSPGTRFDVFILYGQCANVEGYCTFSHDDRRRIWPCVQRYRIEGGEGGGEGAARHGQMLWGGLHRGEACGLCALYDLRRLGIEAVKIVGRGTSGRRKRWAVETVASLIGLAESGKVSREDFTEEARRLYREEFPRGCRPALCYFPELIPVSDG